MQQLGQFPAQSSAKAAKLGAQAPSSVFFGALVMFVIAAGIGWWVATEAKTLFKDYQISKGYHEIDADIGGQSECKTRKFALTSCTVYIRYQGQTQKESFSFFDFSSSDYTVMPVASDSNPNLISIDLAVEKVMNRATFLGIFALIALVVLLFGLRALLVRMPQMAKLLSALNRAENRPWQLVALPSNEDGTAYSTVVDGKAVEMSVNFGKKSPWLLEDANGNTSLLGIAAKNGGAALPLDAELSVLGGLNKSERQQLLQSLNAQLQGGV